MLLSCAWKCAWVVPGNWIFDASPRKKQVPPLCPPKGFYCPTFAPQKMLRYLEKYLENLGMLGVFLWISIETAVRFLLTPSTFCCILCAFFAKSGLKFPIIQAENITQKSSCIFRCRSFFGAATQIRTGDLILTKRLVLAAMSIEISRETPFSRS